MPINVNRIIGLSLSLKNVKVPAIRFEEAGFAYALKLCDPSEIGDWQPYGWLSKRNLETGKVSDLEPKNASNAPVVAWLMSKFPPHIVEGARLLEVAKIEAERAALQEARTAKLAVEIRRVIRTLCTKMSIGPELARLTLDISDTEAVALRDSLINMEVDA